MTSALSAPAPRSTRLELCFDAGLELPTQGQIAVYHPRAGESLSALPQSQVAVVTPHAPDHAVFARFAHELDDRFAAALICLPRARDEALGLIAEVAQRTDGPVIVDGQKTDGIEAVLKALRNKVALSEILSKGHGKIAWFDAREAGTALTEWQAREREITAPSGRSFVTCPGVFSADGIDPASQLLAESLPDSLRGQVADFGAGWGYLSVELLAKSPGIDALHLIEADARALDLARRNMRDPRARFHWADATMPLNLAGTPLYPGHAAPALAFDAVVMNPPFHVGRETRPQLGAAFIQAAARALKPAGTLWLVANRHLPYEPVLAENFATHEEIAGNAGFKVICAQSPQTGPAKASGGKRYRSNQTRGRRG